MRSKGTVKKFKEEIKTEEKRRGGAEYTQLEQSLPIHLINLQIYHDFDLQHLVLLLRQNQ